MNISRLTHKLITISEAIAINYTSNNKYQSFISLISNKYKLGPNKEIKLRGAEHYIMKYGPSTNKFLKDKYVYLFLDFSKNKNEKFGYIESFAVSDKNYTSGFSKNGSVVSVDGLNFKPIPEDFKKFNDVMSLIIGAGADFDNDQTKITSSLIQGTDNNYIVDINRRFEIMAKLVRIISLKDLPGMIIVGEGGLGKTYTVLETLTNVGMLEDEDYLHLQGAKLTTVGFYQLLYENPDKLIIFDDSDSVLNDADRINMLKAALDSGAKDRKITYLSPAVVNLGLETSFIFKGQIIFISNYALKDFDQPLISRSVSVDLSMTRQEVFERMQNIINKMTSHVDKQAQREAGNEDEDTTGKVISKEAQQRSLDLIQDFDKKYPGKPKDLNMRTLGKIAKVLQSEKDEKEGEEIAHYLLSIG